MLFSKYSYYRIRFIKKYNPIGWGQWISMNDAYYIDGLKSLKDKYDFEIVSTDMYEFYEKSTICIKCLKNEYVLIFQDFIKSCGKEMTDISY